MIHNERRRFRGEIIHGIESFSKRAAVRNLKTFRRFKKDQIGLIYGASRVSHHRPFARADVRQMYYSRLFALSRRRRV